jgi:hypothetical protein
MTSLKLNRMWSKKKGNKFGVAEKAQRTIGDKVYDSKKERLFRQKLELLKSAKNDSERVVTIEEQVPFELSVNGHKICKYILDFRVTYADGRVECVDCKGFKGGTAYQVFKLKSKLMLAIHSITVKEV